MNEEFLNFVDELMKSNPDLTNQLMTDNIKKYLDLLKNGNGAGKVLITDKGKNLLKYMKTLTVPMRTADLAAGLGTAGRSLSPVVTKLVASGFVEKIGTSPALYIVTEKGKNFNLD